MTREKRIRVPSEKAKKAETMKKEKLPSSKKVKSVPQKEKASSEKEKTAPKKEKVPPPKKEKAAPKKKSNVTKNIENLLNTIGITDIAATFEGCSTLDDEFGKLKKSYHKKILQVHPDKGGSSADFRDVQSAFEVLRSMYDKKSIVSFIDNISKSTTDQYNDTKTSFSDKPVPSYEYYEQAAEEEVPSYRMEPAKSGRSSCKQKGNACKHTDPAIQKDEIRIGRIDFESGTYINWVHLNCWRVPSKVWLAFSEPLNEAKVRSALTEMNEVLMSGFSELSESDKIEVINYVLNKNNWAKKIKRAPKNLKVEQIKNEPSDPSSQSVNFDPKTAYSSNAQSLIVTKSSSSAIVNKSGGQFQLGPGLNNAKPHALMGKTIVLTGLFPEIGGGAGLNLGKDKLKSIIESFGGKVTGSVSGKTDILIAGKAPGSSKISKAESKGIPIMSTFDLKLGLESGVPVENMNISLNLDNVAFSQGYRGNAVLRIT